MGSDLIKATQTKNEQKATDVYGKIKALAQKWFNDEINDRRFAEAVFGLINTESENEKAKIKA